MNKKISLSKVMAIGVLGSVVTPYTSLADNEMKVAPVKGDVLTRAVNSNRVMTVNEDDLLKTRDDYTISFLGKDNLAKLSEGAVYMAYPVQLHTKTGDTINLGDPFDNKAVDAEFSDFIFENAVRIDKDNPEVKVEYDGVYRIVQLQRAPGEYLNPYLQSEKYMFADWEGLGTDGFEFPMMSGGLISEDQTVEVNTKRTPIDDGVNTNSDDGPAFAELLVAKYGDHDRKPGFLDLSQFFENEPGEDTEEVEGYGFLGMYRQELDIQQKHLNYSYNYPVDFATEENTKGNIDMSDTQRLKGAKYKITMVGKAGEVFSNIEANSKVAEQLKKNDDFKDLNFASSRYGRNAIKDMEEVEGVYEAILTNVDGKEWLFETGTFEDAIYDIAEGALSGLPEGQYVIEEITPPEGYTLTDAKINVLITADYDGVHVQQGVIKAEGEMSNIEEFDYTGFEDIRVQNGAHLASYKDDKGYRNKAGFNNSLQPGTDDPNNPFDEDRKPFIKTSELDEVVTSDEGVEERLVAPGRLFDYNLDFYVPIEIEEYEYLELYDSFDENLNIEDLKVVLKNNDTDLLEDTDFKVHTSENKLKVVFTKDGLSKLEGNSYVDVKLQDVRIREDLTKEQIDNLEKTGIDNIAKLHFDNGKGTVVNPNDPDKPVDEDNPHVTPNPEDPFIPGEEVEPKDPEYQPEVPESNITTVIPTAHDFRFTKVNKEDRGLEGAMFVIVDGEISSQYGKSEDALTNKFDIDEYEKLIKENKVSEANKMLTDFESKEFEIDEHTIEGRNLVATSDTDGKVEFKGLPAGKYTIREVKAPNGYRVSPLPIEVTVAGSVEGKEATTNLSVKYNGETHNFAELEDTDLKIVNYKYNETPETGTLGKLGYIAAGTLVLSLGVVAKKKKED